MNWIEFAIAREAGQLLRAMDRRPLTKQEAWVLESITPVVDRLRDNALEKTIAAGLVYRR
jgi:hypothetical protein